MRFSRQRLLSPIATAVLFAGLAPALVAQGRGVGFVSAVPSHSFMKDGVAGATLNYAWPLSGGRRSIFVTMERLGGVTRRVGTPCSGLIPPGTCADEPLRDDARLTTASAGLGYGLFTRSRLSADLSLGLRAGRVETSTIGQTSGGTLRGDKAMWGGDVGLDVTWAPASRIPLALTGGAAAGGLIPISPANYTDGGGGPLDGFTSVRVRAGLVWWPRSRR